MGRHETPSILSDTMLHRLRSDILSLVLPPNYKLNTQMLESRYHAGLSPVREALCALAGEGLVVREDRKGFRVAPMSLIDFDALTSLRVAIELSSLEQAFQANRVGWQHGIDASLEALGPDVKVGDGRPLGRDWERRHRRFHFSLLDVYRSPIALEFCNRVYDRYDRYRSLALPRLAFLATVGEDHRSMAETVGSRDLTRTKELLARHIGDTSATIKIATVDQGICGEAGEVTLEHGRAEAGR